MTDQKVTTMELKVDLQCPCCYKKIKKILCQFPQIRDQKYDEKKNTVTITVVCSNPEKIRCKLCYKGGKIIKGIEIKPPPKPPESEKPKEPQRPKEPEKPKEPQKPKEPEKPKKPTPACCGSCSGHSGGPCHPDHPRPTCCGPCSQGVPGGPCYLDHGGPTCCGSCSKCVPRCPCHQGAKLLVSGYYNYGYGSYSFCGSRCGRVYHPDCFCEENPSECRTM